MNAITVTREYGAGGYEVAHQLAELLGWELLDRELLHRAAAVEHLPDADLEALDEKAISLADRFRLHPPHQRVMEHRWLREGAARTLIANSDTQRRHFYESYFGAARAGGRPLEYHVTVNSGRLGPAAVDLIVLLVLAQEARLSQG